MILKKRLEKEKFREKKESLSYTYPGSLLQWAISGWPGSIKKEVSG